MLSTIIKLKEGEDAMAKKNKNKNKRNIHGNAQVEFANDQLGENSGEGKFIKEFKDNIKIENKK